MLRFSLIRRTLAFFLTLAGLLLAAPAAAAQHGGGGGMHGGGGPFGGGGGGVFPGNMNRGFNHGGPPPGNAAESAGTVSAMRGGLQLGPPGRWWDEKHFAKDLKLRSDQQHRMDSIFESNRSSLLHRLQDLEAEQSRMETLTHAKTLDEVALFAQIDRVAQARAELEKANTHYLLQIRNEMDPDQLSRLEQHH